MQPSPDALDPVAPFEHLDVPRLSQEVHPQNLADLFAADPECTKEKEGGKDTRALLFAGAKLDDEMDMKKLQVFVRIRPPVAAGAPAWDAENSDCIHASSAHSLAIAPPESSLAYRSGDRGQTFSFTRVFDAATSQGEYYASSVQPLVSDMLVNAQHNSVIMAYGITAAGKTYTIEGTKAAPGVMPQALQGLFAGLASHVEAAALGVRISYCEIYNEAVYDLLDDMPSAWPRERPALKLKEDARGKVFVAGLAEVEVHGPEEALALLRRGARQRQRAETGSNYASSRSHSIFSISIVHCSGSGRDAAAGGGSEEAPAEDQGGAVQVERLGRMAFVDLAGSERAQRTGNIGVRLKESMAINSSLMTLGRCLETLRWNQKQQHVARAGAAAGPLKVVPYRESKVTHLFRDALHGYGRVVLSVNVSPCARDYDETCHVLRYAALATQIGTLQQAAAPRRTVRAVTPNAVRRAKRKAQHARHGDGQGKKVKGGAGSPQRQELPQEGTDSKHAAAADDEATEESLATHLAGQPDTAACDSPAQSQECLEQDAHGAAVLPEGAEPGADDGGEIVYDLQQHQSPLQQEGSGLPLRPPSPQAAIGDAEPASPFVLAIGSVGRTSSAFAAVPDADGVCLEDCATPCTPTGGDNDGAVAALQAQVQELVGHLQAAEERCVLLEGEVREEVAAEMAQLLKDMEESYKERLAVELAALVARETAAGNRDKSGRRGQKGAKQPARAAPSHASGDPEPRPDQSSIAAAEAATAEAQASAAAAIAASEAAAAEAASLRGELELHCMQVQAQAERISRLEASTKCAAAQLEESRAEAAAHQGRVTELEAELDGERGRWHALHAQLVEMRRRSQEVETVAAVAAAGFEDRLKEEVTQVEANNAMQLEMAEEQADRLRKQNLALRQQLQAAMSTLAMHSTPSAIPLFQRMAAACPQGNGRGAGGTPHDIALARARMAAAQEEIVPGSATAPSTAGPPGSAAAAPGSGLLLGASGSDGFRAPSRFALEASFQPEGRVLPRDLGLGGSQPHSAASPGPLEIAASPRVGSDSPSEGGSPGKAGDDQPAVDEPQDAGMVSPGAQPDEPATLPAETPHVQASHLQLQVDGGAVDAVLAAGDEQAQLCSPTGPELEEQAVPVTSPEGDCAAAAAPTVGEGTQQGPAEAQPSPQPVVQKKRQKNRGRASRAAKARTISAHASPAASPAQLSEAAEAAPSGVEGQLQQHGQSHTPAATVSAPETAEEPQEVAADEAVLLQDTAAPGVPTASQIDTPSQPAPADVVVTAAAATEPVEEQAAASQAAEMDQHHLASPAAAEAVGASQGQPPARRVTRRMSRLSARQENTESSAPVAPPAAAAGRVRKRRLQPAKPLSAAMRDALGELAEGELPLKDATLRTNRNVAVQPAAGFSALGGTGGKPLPRTRRNLMARQK